MDLFSNDLTERELAAANYKTFPTNTEIPAQYAMYWQTVKRNGLDWPSDMRELASPTIWPEHAFGVANAGVVVFWHRPGSGAGSLEAGAHIGPRIPVLSGLAHPHVKHWPTRHPSPSWQRLHKYLAQALQGLRLRDWAAQVMVACINPVPGPTGSTDKAANRASAQSGGAMDTITRLCRPRLVLLCGGEVKSVGPIYKRAHPGVTTLEVPHPLKWDGHGGEKMRGGEIARLIQTALN